MFPKLIISPILSTPCPFNRFVWKESVHYEDIRTVFDLFQSGYFSLPLILNLDIIMSKFFLIIASIWVFLGVMVQRLSILFLMFCLLACLRRRTFSLS